MHSSLVMQDRETDSYWAIMTDEAIAGQFKGTKLVELPVSKKVKWKDWVKEHPNTLVLSVDGREDGFNPYASYFTSPRGFRGTSAKDKRLRTKEPIFAFRLRGKSYAVAQKDIEGGKAFDLGDIKLFLYRPKGAEMFYSTAAFIGSGSGFKKVDGKWTEVDSGCTFDPEKEVFSSDSGNCVQRLDGGFDTFWYNWSLSNPNTQLLK